MYLKDLYGNNEISQSTFCVCKSTQKERKNTCALIQAKRTGLILSKLQFNNFQALFTKFDTTKVE